MEEKLVKQISELSKKSQLFDILIAVEISKLFIGDNTNLIINERLSNYNRISKFFETNNIFFDSFSSTSFNITPPSFEVQFGEGVNFQDLFIIASILKIFGLKSLSLDRFYKNKIYIGSYPHDLFMSLIPVDYNDLQYFVHKTHVISVDDFLIIPFDTQLSEIIDAKMWYPDAYFKDLEQVREDYWRDKGVFYYGFNIRKTEIF